jgi:putative methyltransferase (TIGR04325 family)
MKVKRLIRAIVPARLYHAAHHVKRAIIDTESVLEPANTPSSVKLSFSPKSSFAEAIAECGKGYETAEVLNKAHLSRHAWLDGMQDYQGPFLASFAVAALEASDPVKVLDFGGGNAVSRAQVNDFFAERYKTDWTVVEVPQQVLHNSDLGLHDLRYSTEIGTTAFDLAIFAGSLQYVENWQAPLIEANAKTIFISRTPIGDVGQAYVQSVARNAHYYKLPAQVIPRVEMFDLLSKRYKLFASWDFKSHLVEMGLHDSPAMLWKRQ